jgi:hypothetical protein
MGNAVTVPENTNTSKNVENVEKIEKVEKIEQILKETNTDENNLISKIKTVLESNTEVDDSSWKKDDKFKTADGRIGTVNFKRVEPYYINKNYYNVTFDGNITETLYPANDMFDALPKEERIKLNKEHHENEIQKILDNEYDQRLKVLAITTEDQEKK